MQENDIISSGPICLECGSTDLDETTLEPDTPPHCDKCLVALGLAEDET